MFIVDTNIWLELLLGQENAEQTIAMKRNNLELITFDKDFAKQNVKSHTPQQAIEYYLTH